MIWRHQNQADYIHRSVCEIHANFTLIMFYALTLHRKVSSSIYGYYKAETSSFDNPHEL